MQPSRRSARLRDKPIPKNEEGPPPKKDSKTRTRKRRRGNDAPKVPTAQPTKRGRGGKLRNLPEMPLDILFEIFGHLLPHDILRLSRTTKAMRKILMTQSAICVWKSARQNVSGIPNCPPELSEPAYANLAFDTHCHYCGMPGAKTVHWFLFKRTCHSCQQAYINSIVQDGLPRILKLGASLDIPEERLLGLTLECLPIYKFKCLRDQLIDALRTFEAIQDAEERAKWLECKTKQMKERQKFASACEHWLLEWRDSLADEAEEARARRSSAILDRMRMEGWGDVVSNLGAWDRMEFDAHKSVRQTKDLTERMWINMKPAMIELFETFQHNQQRRFRLLMEEKRTYAFKDAFNAYCRSIPYDSVVAPMAHIVAMDSVQELIYHDDVKYLPSQEDFLVAFAGIPQVTAEWKTNLDRSLYQLIYPTQDEEAAQSPTQVDTSKLQLATSLFDCTECQTCCLSYKQLLIHSHKRYRYLPFIADAQWPKAIAACYEYLECKPVEGSMFTLCNSHLRMRFILEACDLNVTTTTMDELEQLDPLLECTAPQPCCRYDSVECTERHAFFWCNLLQGPFESTAKASQFRVLKPENLLGHNFKAKRYEHYDNAYGLAMFGCKHCYSPNPMSFTELKKHLFDRHGIEIRSREAMEHYIIHPAVGTRQRKYDILVAPKVVVAVDTVGSSAQG